ncbi:hypothetical protein D8I24_7477 [Cupriavidus necator H850]|nr:hypothetical protein D8I24_7477 [Cupriavidus necator H850]
MSQPARSSSVPQGLTRASVASASARLRVGVVQVDGQARLRGDLRDAPAHGAGADDTQRIDGESAHHSSQKLWLN